MSNKTTAQDWYNSYYAVLAQMPPEKRAFFGDLPATYDELSDEDKARFQSIAWTSNLIIGEFEVKRGEDHV